jgi:hypothetical protein
MPGASTDIRRSACRGCKPSATSCTTKWRSATSTRGPRPMHTRNAAGFAATSRIWRLHSVALPEHPGALLHRLYHGHRRFSAVCADGQRQRNFGDSHMSPRLVASNDDRVLAIRDHFLLLVRQDGELEVQRGLVRMVTWEHAPWVITGRRSMNCSQERHPRRATGTPWNGNIQRRICPTAWRYGTA